MKTSDLIKILIKDTATLTSLPVAANYSEDTEDNITINHVGTSNFNDPALSYEFNSVIKSSSISFTIKTTTYSQLVGIYELLQEAFDNKANLTFSDGSVVKQSYESSYFEIYQKEARRHFATVDFIFNH